MGTLIVPFFFIPLLEFMCDKYKNNKKLLNKQIESGVDHKWAWRQGDNEEFVCIHIYIPKWSSEIYTAKQLLKKLNESNC